jgi:hypothetical protein
MYRQGDVLLRPITLTSGDRERLVYRPRSVHAAHGRNKGIVLAAGEATGHHHRIKDKSVKEYLLADKRIVRVGNKGGTITHEEHDPITLPKGDYEVVQQREFDPPAPTPEKPRSDPFEASRYSRPVYD